MNERRIQGGGSTPLSSVSKIFGVKGVLCVLSPPPLPTETFMNTPLIVDKIVTLIDS